VLSDPKKKQRYDLGGGNFDMDDNFGDGGFGNIDPNEIFNMFF
jgi:DnaJ-class molecular chaperone